MKIFSHPLLSCMNCTGRGNILLKNVWLSTYCRSNQEFLHLHIMRNNKGFSYSTLKKKIWKHQDVFAAYVLPESSVNLKNFFARRWELFQGFYTVTDFFAIQFIELDKILFICGKQKHSSLISMLHHFNENFGFGQVIIHGSLGQELSSSYRRPPLKISTNRTLDCYFTNHQLFRECPHRLPRIFIVINDEFWCLANVISSTMSFLV